MSRRTIWNRAAAVVLPLAWFLGSLPAAAEPDDEAAIRALFDQYRQALFDHDGAAAYKLVDQETHEYYARMLEATKHASKSEVRAMRPVDKSIVLMGRALIPKRQLKKLNPKSYFKYCAEQGWFDQFAAENVEIAKIQVEGDAAITHSKRGDTVVPYGFVFRRESDGWKLAITQLLPFFNEQLERYVEDQDISVDEFILQSVSAVSGVSVENDIWTPPL